MSERNDWLLILDIIEAIERLERYTKGKFYSEFVDDDMMKDAVERIFILIGEAANRISNSTKNATPDIPWQKIADMRHRIVHEYFGVDYKTVWRIIEIEIPDLKKNLLKLKPES